MGTIFPPDHLVLTHVNEIAPSPKTSSHRQQIPVVGRLQQMVQRIAHVARPGEDHVVAGAAEDRVVVVERGIGRINRRSENEIVAGSGVNDALRTVKELSAVRCQHGVRKGGYDSMSCGGGVDAIEKMLPR